MAGQKIKYNTVDVSWLTFLKVAVFLLGVFFLYFIRDVLFILFFAIVLASAFDPIVSWFEKFKIPRSLAILLIYIFFLGAIALFIVTLVPVFITQAQELLKILPQYFDRAVNGYESIVASRVFGDLDQLLSQATRVFGNNSSVFSFLSGVVGGVFSVVIILVITFYLLVEENAIKKTFRFLAPPRHQPYLTQLFSRIQLKIGMWLRGQLILSLIVGLMAFIGLSILGLPYALVLGLMAALFEFVPYLGPILAAIPAILLGLFISPLLALFVLILYLVLQRVENDILVPKVMQRTIGLNPLITIVSLLVGGKLGGVMGMLLAIPVATAMSVVIADFFESREEDLFPEVHDTKTS